MTKVILLEQLKAFTEDVTREILLPVQMQEKDESQPPDRAASVYVPRLPKLSAYKQKAPFITHESVTSKDILTQAPNGYQFMQASAVVRSCFCVYHPNEQEGGLALLNLMERLRIALLETVVIGKQFTLDVKEGVESLVYPSNPNQTANSPFYLGEMITTWRLPSVERIISNEKVNWNGGGIRQHNP